jgi:glycosyltransferase involved in cell wall biosynthesis
MRICIIGKFPPIQGGVSMRTYWAAHGLAKLGHSVHVVTNAAEAGAPCRMHMRAQDWARCNARYGAGSVQVHWTEDYGARQSHIPQASAFVTKLASLALEVARAHAVEVVYSHYTEPYSVAGHLVARSARIPHVARTAGSDAGRLWSLPQFASLYSEIYRSAHALITNPSVTQKMIDAGVPPSRLAQDGESVRLDEIFTPQGPALDVEGLRRDVRAAEDPGLRELLFGEFDPALSYFGIYGKLGRTKGTYALLRAVKELKEEGAAAGLLVLAHEFPASAAFREAVAASGLQERVCQLPFVPHWRVPEFILRCVAVCCLEQDFPIAFHTPAVAREVLTCGGCLVGSMEVVRKLPLAHKLVDGYNCVALADVNDTASLKRGLRCVLDEPERVAEMRQRAREHGAELDRDNAFPRKLESILSDIVQTGRLRPENVRPAARALPEAREPFSRLRAALGELAFKDKMALLQAPSVLGALRADIVAAEKTARRRRQPGAGRETARVFRLHRARGFFDESTFDDMVPEPCEAYSLLELPGNLGDDDPMIAKSFARRQRRPGRDAGAHRLWAFIPEDESHTIRIVDDVDAALVRACDGSKSVGALCNGAGAGLRERMLSLFKAGLIALRERT